MSARGRYWVLAGLMGLAFALRVANLDSQSLWRDEVDALRFAGRPLGELLELLTTPGQNGPLYYLSLRPWLDVAGQSEFALRFFSVAFGVLAVPLIYRLARRLFPSSPSVALVSALLAATSPYLVWYAQEGKMYALVVSLALLSMDRYLAALARGGWQRWLLYVVATSAAFYVHLVAALIVPAQMLAYLLLSRETRRLRRKPWLASMAALTLPYLPLLAWQLPLLLEAANTGYRIVPLPDMLSSLVANYGLGVVQGATVWNTALFVGLALAAGLLAGRDRARLASVGILACWLVVPVAGFYGVTLIRPMYTARYLIFVLPAYLLLLAAGLAAVGRRSRWLAGLLLAGLLAVNGWGLWLQAQTPLKTDFRAATRYLVERLSPGNLIIFQIPHGRFSFDYYLERDVAQPDSGDYRLYLPLVAGGGGGEAYRWAEGLYTNAGMPAEEADHRMAQLTAGSRVVWLVASEVELWDERGLVQAWLAEQAELSDEAAFVRVAVYRYELP